MGSKLFKLKLTGSSFLIPTHKAWSSLSGSYDIEFDDYGNWDRSLLHSANEVGIALIFFFDDFLEFQNKTEEKTKVLFSSIISLLEQRLKQAIKPTVICFTSGENTHLIRRSKTIDMKRKIHQWFAREMELLANKYNSFFFIDLDLVFSEVGISKVFNNRNWYFAHCRVSNTGLSSIANAIERVLNRYNNPSSKVLVLDCDNTIWGGVIGEDELNSIKLGQDGLGKAFVDFQRTIKLLSKEGLLLAIASKNNEKDIWNTFEKHKSMV